MSPDEVLDRYEAIRSEVMDAATRVLDEEPLGSRDAVMAPLALPPSAAAAARSNATALGPTGPTR